MMVSNLVTFDLSPKVWNLQTLIGGEGLESRDYIDSRKVSNFQTL